MTTVDALQDRLAGPMTALITPFDPDGRLDLDVLDVHVAFQLQHRVPVLVPCGTIGEFPSLSLGERWAVIERTVRAAGGRAAVLAGVSDVRPEVVCALAGHAREVGADGLLVMAPPFFKLTEEEQFAFWSWLDEHLELPFVLYSTTATASGLPGFALLERLGRLRHFAGIKEASPDLPRFHELVRRFGHRFPIIAAAESALPYTLLAGASGLMTASTCFAPALMWQLFEATRAGDVVRLLARFEPVARFRNLFQARMDAGYPAYLPFTKAACELVGLRSGDPRPPLAPITGEERDALTAVLRDAFRFQVEREGNLRRNGPLGAG